MAQYATRAKSAGSRGMLTRSSSILKPLVIAGAVALLAPSASAAKPKIKPATCDEVPGRTNFASTKWRAFWRPGPRPDKVVPVYACERTGKPTRSLIRLSLGYDAALGHGSVTAISGDVLTYTEWGRYGGSSTHVDLRSLKTLPGSSTGLAKHDESKVLDSGAILRFADRTRVGDERPATELGHLGVIAPESSRVGDVTVHDSAGRRVVAQGSQFGEFDIVSAVDGPYEVASDRDAVYFSDAAWQPHRVRTQGTAKGLHWGKSNEVRRLKRSFRVPARSGDRPTPIAGTTLQSKRGPNGEIWLQRRLRTFEDYSTFATLHAGAASDLVVKDGPAQIVIARFSDDPTAGRRLRVYMPFTETGVDAPAPSPADAKTLVTNRAGDIAYRNGAAVTIWVRQGLDATPWYVEQTVSASPTTSPVLADSTVYYDRPDGQLTALRLR